MIEREHVFAEFKAAQDAMRAAKEGKIDGLEVAGRQILAIQRLEQARRSIFHDIFPLDSDFALIEDVPFGFGTCKTKDDTVQNNSVKLNDQPYSGILETAMEFAKGGIESAKYAALLVAAIRQLENERNRIFRELGIPDVELDADSRSEISNSLQNSQSVQDRVSLQDLLEPWWVNPKSQQISPSGHETNLRNNTDNVGIFQNKEMESRFRAIETEYNGYRFRSRAEARWAVFFDKLDLKYLYEPEGYNLDGISYLPDFYLPDFDYWIEIKPKLPLEGEEIKAKLLSRATGERVYIFFGGVPLTTKDFNNGSAYSYFQETKEIHQRWCECPNCMRLGIVFKGDPSLLSCGCVNKDNQPIYNNIEYQPTARLLNAYKHARSARFENR